MKYLNPADCSPARITKANKGFSKKFDFKNVKLPVKIRGIHKIEKRNSLGFSIFGYETKKKHQIYVSKKCCEGKYVDLLLIGRKGIRHYVLINIYIFCHYYLQAFSAEKMLKSNIKDSFEIKGKK